MNIFSIDFIVITLFNYQLSLVELAGTLTGMLSVYLTAKEKVSCWPVGIINILFFLVLFYQVRLYSDVLLQLYFLVMSFYGWWKWTHPGRKEETNGKQELKITELTRKSVAIALVVSGGAVLLLGAVTANIHKYLPRFFPAPAALPFPDAFTTVLSITATILMTCKKRQCWLFWIAVDCAAVIIYFIKGVNLVAVEYIIFGIMALQGYLNWTKMQTACKTGEAVLPQAPA